MASEAVATTTKPTDVGLKRDMGLIGATWASETSIIGSGWLFAAFGAAVAAGPAALIGWVIGGIAVIILALVHSELGSMYPVAGGTARFPHLAFGSVAGMSFGFFSWLQAVTVAPIECFAVMQYASYYWPSLYNADKGVTTTNGFIATVILMAVFTAINFLAMKTFTKVNSAITWWKVAVPVFTIIVLLFFFHPGNFTKGGGFMPFGIKAVFAAIPGAGIVFAYLGFEQADQLAGEIKNPQRNLPRAIIYAVLIGTVIYIMLQVVFIGATKPSLLTHGFAGISSTNPVAVYPFAGVAALAGLGWLATILHIDAFISPFGTGLVYQTSTSRVGYGLGRNRYYPQVLTKTDKNGVPWVSLILAFVFGLVFLLPFPSWKALVGLVTGASVLMYAGAPLSLGAFRGQVPDADRPYRHRAARVHHREPDHLLVRPRGALEARHLHRHRLRHHGRLHGVRREPAAAGLEVRAVAAGLPGRHGHHLLAGPVQRRRGQAAGEHRQHPVLVGLPGGRGVQPGDLLLGDGHQAAQGRDARAGREAVRHRAGRADPALTR